MAAHDRTCATRSVPCKLEQRLGGSTCQKISNPERVQLHGNRAFQSDPHRDSFQSVQSDNSLRMAQCDVNLASARPIFACRVLTSQEASLAGLAFTAHLNS